MSIGKRIITTLRQKKHMAENWFDYLFRNERLHCDGEHRIFLLLTPNYGNLGDQAIAQATIEFIRNELPHYNLITVSLDDIYKFLPKIEEICTSKDIIFLQGGGNMGSLYPEVEMARQFVISRLKKCPIISFPTSIKYLDDKYSDKLKNKSIKIYSGNKKLILLMRDNNSFSIAKQLYPSTKIYLFPDVVLYLHRIKKDSLYRHNILICLRRDMESALDEKTYIKIIERIFMEYSNAYFVDTQVARNIPDELRKAEITGIINEFLGAKVIITDRLHGMIFAAITSTPCVVLNSMDGKVKATYEWLKELNYICFIDQVTPDSISNGICKVTQIYEKSKLTSVDNYFEQLIKLIENLS